MKKILTFLCVVMLSNSAFSQKVDYSVVSVPEESGIEFVLMSTDADYVCLPAVKRSGRNLDWFTNRILAITPDGTSLAFLSFRNNTTNIFVKDLTKQSGSVQRTNRSGVIDFSYSKDGKYLAFSEKRGNATQLFQTDAKSGFTCRQLTTANQDYSPIYSNDNSVVFFTRQEARSTSIWTYSLKENFLSNYTQGLNPYPLPDEKAYLCTRFSSEGRGEIWKVNYETAVEECILSSTSNSFTSPVLSPDGRWILCVGSTAIPYGASVFMNTDIYVCRTDGTLLTQLTYHAADDLSPVWSSDGKYIYFVSQRGSASGTANIWRMSFNH